LSECSTLSLHDALPICEYDPALARARVLVAERVCEEEREECGELYRRVRGGDRAIRVAGQGGRGGVRAHPHAGNSQDSEHGLLQDRKSTRLNSSHQIIS